MTSRRLLLFISSLIFLAGLASTTEASTISLTPSSPGMIQSTCSTHEPACIYTTFSLVNNGSLVLYYKGDPSNADLGSFANYYDTSYDDPSDASAATITWVGTSPNFIGCPSCYLVIKDGEGNTPPYYLYDLSSWNGQDTLALSQFWPTNGAISHVSIWGGTIQLQAVPEPATLLLLGTGLALVAARLRHRAAARS